MGILSRYCLRSHPQSPWKIFSDVSPNSLCLGSSLNLWMFGGIFPGGPVGKIIKLRNFNQCYYSGVDGDLLSAFWVFFSEVSGDLKIHFGILPKQWILDILGWCFFLSSQTLVHSFFYWELKRPARRSWRWRLHFNRVSSWFSLECMILKLLPNDQQVSLSSSRPCWLVDLPTEN